MELVSDNKVVGELDQIGQRLDAIVERRETKDMWEMGEDLCRGRAICEDPDKCEAEGIEGKAPNNRFNAWLSSYANLAQLKPKTRERAMDLHRVFGDRRQEFKDWKTSVLYELAGSANADFRDQVITHFHNKPKPPKALEMRAYIKSLSDPAPIVIPSDDDDEGSDEATDSTPTVTPASNDKATATPVKAIPLADADWDKLIALVKINTDELRAAEDDQLHPQFMLARRLKAIRNKLTISLAGLSKPEQRRSMKAIVDVLMLEQEVFEANAKALMPKYNRDLAAKLKFELDEQRKITKQMRKLAKDRFELKDFKKIRSVLHPDQTPTTKQLAEAFDLFQKLEPFYRG